MTDKEELRNDIRISTGAILWRMEESLSNLIKIQFALEKYHGKDIDKKWFKASRTLAHALTILREAYDEENNKPEE